MDHRTRIYHSPRRRRPSRKPIISALVIACAVIILAFSQLRGETNKNNNTSSTNTSVNGTLTNSPTENENTNIAISEERVTYEDAQLGFSLAYPEAWKRTMSENGEGENRIVNYVFQDDTEGVTLIIVDQSMEGIVRDSFSVTNEKTTTINGRTAQHYDGTSAKDGSPMGLIFFRSDDTVYILNGSPDRVEQIGATFQITN